jgi:uncharacterized protein (DUF4415 family)
MKRGSKTDWARVDRLSDSGIDYSDNPELGDDFFLKAVRWPGRKRQITLRLSPDVLTFFRNQGKGYQTSINSVLQRYVELQERRVGSRSQRKVSKNTTSRSRVRKKSG